jgi:hypothetical protein
MKTSLYSGQVAHVSPELFGPGHFVGLGLILKSEIRTRTRARTWART